MPQSYEYFLRFPNKVAEMFRWARALYIIRYKVNEMSRQTLQSNNYGFGEQNHSYCFVIPCILVLLVPDTIILTRRVAHR